ncbi:MAG TPA: sulfatase-like hydrolase/transferase, partial [Myxococcota bacterium]|nr:sulfatase-like hydrolase/transferase [Myxococcota bacterium]
PSAAAAMTGLDLEHHGLRWVDQGNPEATVTAPTLAGAFSEAGYRTALFSGSTWMSTITGLDAGFDRADLSPELYAKSNLGTLGEDALNWLDRGEGPFLMVLHPMDPHDPYSPEEQDRGVYANNLPFDLDNQDQKDQVDALLETADEAERAALMQNLRDVYDEQLVGLGRSLEQLLGGLEDRGLLDHTLVVFTADHGESFDEGGEIRHGASLRQEQLIIPLMFLHPEVPAGDLSCLSNNLDLLPTLLDLFDLPPLATTDGRSLQQDCRRSSIATLYYPGGLWWVANRSAEGRVAVECRTSNLLAYNLVDDPLALQSVELSSLNDGAQLIGELGARVDALIAADPSLSCRMP